MFVTFAHSAKFTQILQLKQSGNQFLFVKFLSKCSKWDWYFAYTLTYKKLGVKTVFK